MERELGIKLRKFNRVCPITGYKEGSIRVGAYVVVKTDRGEEFGQIISFRKGIPRSISRDVRLKKVIRYATAQDMTLSEDLEKMEKEAFQLGNRKIKEHELRIKLISVEYIFDCKRIIFYYKEEGKKVVNIKDLGKDLSATFKIHIDLTQLSPRDEARILGGLGPCGRALCCAVWLEKPKHITVKMVKEQGLSISPMRTSGLCGRLMCCLGYEHEEKGGNKDAKN